MFLEDKLQTVGVEIDFGTHKVTMYFTLGNILLDGEAIRQIFSAKGAKGKLPCVACLNVLNSTNLPAGFVGLTCTDPDRFELASNSDIWEKVDMLSAQFLILNKGKFKDLETSLGMVHNPLSILWDRDLRPFFRPADCLTFDSMHVLGSDGLLGVELELMLSALADIGYKWAQYKVFFGAQWRASKFHGRVNWNSLFTPSREAHFNNSGRLSWSAGEYFAAFPLFNYFLDSVVAKQRESPLLAERMSFRALNLLLALVKESKAGEIDSTKMQQACVAHAKAFDRAFPNCATKTKTHWAFHLALQARRDQVTMDCFTGERAHGRAKEAAHSVKNVHDLENSVMKRMLVSHCALLQDESALMNQMARPVRCHEMEGDLFGVREAWVSSVFVLGSLHFCQDDVAIIDGEAVLVIGAASLDGRLSFLCDRLRVVEEVAGPQPWFPASTPGIRLKPSGPAPGPGPRSWPPAPGPGPRSWPQTKVTPTARRCAVGEGVIEVLSVDGLNVRIPPAWYHEGGELIILFM